MKVKGAEQAKLWSPRYSYAEADYLADVSRGTSKRWLSGYTYLHGGERVTQPPVTPGRWPEGAVSFIDLVEIVAIGKLKEFGFSLPRVRDIVGNCQSFFHVERPLVTLKFKVGGQEAFVSIGSELTEVGRNRGMRAWREILEPFLEDLDYTEGFASRWWPMGRDNPIMLDPDYAFGFPVIRHSGVRTEIILERFQAGDLKDQIAEDFSVEPVDVERALQFELRRAA